MLANLPETFNRHVLPEPNSGCWLWTGYLHHPCGYGRYGKVMAHRASYEAVNGARSARGLVIHHRCGVRNCVNPDHLQAVPHETNIILGASYPDRFWCIDTKSVSPGGRHEGLQDRFLRFVERQEGCWVWKGAKGGGRDRPRYGVFGVGGKLKYAHRVSHQIFKGPIPHGKEIDHLCRNTFCVNPSHLEIVTAEENKLRAKVSSCKRGHPFDEANTWYEKNGCRHCRKCHADNERRKRAGKRIG